MINTGAPIMLLRKYIAIWLSDGTRLVVKTTMPHVSETTTITANMCEIALILRIPLTSNEHPLQLKNCRFLSNWALQRLSKSTSIGKDGGGTYSPSAMTRICPVGNEESLYIRCYKRRYTEHIIYEAGSKYVLKIDVKDNKVGG